MRVPHSGFTPQHRMMGTIAAWAACFLGIAYAVTLLFGLLSLPSPQDPIGDPFFSLLELIIILMAPVMVAVMIAVHAYASPYFRVHSLMALACMILTAGITSSVHFVILTVSRQIEADGFSQAGQFFSFRWPSVAYALDILAWDVFFALSMLSAAWVFKEGRLEKIVRTLMLTSGGLSLAGLIGVPLADMQIRMIGVLGYAGLPPVIFFLIAILFRRSQNALQEDEGS